MIHLRLLGGFEAHGPDGAAVQVDGRKGRALLAYLASPPGRQRTREQVCGLLWGDRGEAQARGSLRQLLTSLRKAFGGFADGTGSAFVTSRESVGLDASAVDTDAEAFERHLRLGTPASLAAALALYRGAFLDGLELDEAGFDDWAGAERRRLHDAARQACRLLLRQAEAAADASLARRAATRLVELEPSDEEGHRALMRLHAAEGDAAAALRQHRLCRDLLRRDLDVAPSAETDALAGEIRRRSVAVAAPAGPARAGAFPDRPTPEPTIPDPPALDPAGPRLVILPFEAEDDDPAERRLADGVVQDIATELSRFRGLLVRVGTSSGADFAVSGSIRRLGSRVRIAARLVNAGTGVQVWAENYDRPQEAVFAVLDELVGTLVATLVGRVEAALALAARRKPPASLAAYECVLRADALPVGDPAAEAEARALYQRAIDLDPGYARAHAMLAYQLSLVWFDDLGGPDDPLDRALELARSAVALDPCDSIGHGILGWVHLLRRSFELAEMQKRRALELVPNSVYETACMGVLRTYLGETDAALACFARARALDPFYEPAWFWRIQGIAHFLDRRYDEAVACLERTPTMPLWDVAYLAACHALAGRPGPAAAMAARLVAIRPDFTASRFLAREPLRQERHLDLLRAGLRRAGVPE